jgi:lactate dehydrogenase-like 2-hydroxyacid dehydrogenase
MSRPVIIVTRKLPEAVEAAIAAEYDATFNPDDRLWPVDELIDRCRGAEGIFACHTDDLNATTIARLPESVRIVGNISVGVDHVDLDAAKRRGLVVTNTPGVLADATAELTMMLMLCAARRASEGDRLVRAGRWTSWSPTFMLGTQLTGKRLGIVGMGGVGQVVARRARGFDMEVHYHNRTRLPEAIEQGAVFHETLDSLLPVSEFLALHCPATPETEGLLNAERIERLPRGAIVVNAARGAVVNETDLLAALRSGRVAAAGLDVFRKEPDAESPFRELDNVFLMPHLGSATVETRNAMGFKVLENLRAFFAGASPPNRVA